MARTPVSSTNVERIELRRREQTTDLVAVEEPLQIILEHGEANSRDETPLAMTMRTPGHDHDLVTGFLYAEGVICGVDDLISVRHCLRSDTPDNVVRAVLKEGVGVPSRLLERNLTVTSACGVCGERTVESLSKEGCERVRHTGGTHGAALFDHTGELLLHREDVGRHNALDKLVGAWLAGPIPASTPSFVVVSSRASFELVQKTVRAGLPMMVAIGAATSLAIETARRFDLTLVGFARENRFNVYSSGERIALEATNAAFVQVEAG
jgi:FdhD protein